MSKTNAVARRRFAAGVSIALLAGAPGAPGIPGIPGVGALGADIADEAAATPWRVGCGRREITPPLDAGILMSSGQGKWAPFEGVRLPLYARAVVIDDGRCRLGLVALDLLGLAGEAVGGMEDFKRRVSVHAGHALETGQIVLASTHTHSAPESLALSDLYRTKPFKDWVNVLAARIGAALSEAAQSLRPGRLTAGSSAAAGLAVNRRIKTARGIAFYNSVRPTDVTDGPEGPTDDRVRVLALVDPSGRPKAILVNASAHPVYEMCIKQVSPDYPGEMTRLLEERHPGTTALFFQGAAGNIDPPRVSTGPADAQRHGRQLADRVDRALGSLRPVEHGRLAIRWRSIRLPARTLTGELQREPLPAAIGAARLGNAAMVFLPGEPFVEIGLAIREASPFEFTAVVGYAESYLGYIPTDRAFANGGYETLPGRWSRVAVGSAEIVRREAVELLKSLKNVP